MEEKNNFNVCVKDLLLPNHSFEQNEYIHDHNGFSLQHKSCINDAKNKNFETIKWVIQILEYAIKKKHKGQFICFNKFHLINTYQCLLCTSYRNGLQTSTYLLF